MTAIPAIAPSPHPGLLGRLLRSSRTSTEVRRAHRELASLSDHLLRDMGLTRDEVHYLAKNGLDPKRDVT